MNYDRRLSPFGFLFGSIFILLGIFVFWRTHGDSIIIAGVVVSSGIILFLISLLNPLFFRIPYYLWILLGKIMGMVAQRFILALFFFGPILVLALAMRLFRRDPLNMINKTPKSFWIARSHDPKWDDPSVNYHNQF